MLTIRLFRTGKKGQPFYKIVVTDRKNAAHNGRFVEEVGVINPLKKDRLLKAERIKYWLKVGAKPSPTVYNLLITEKIIEGKKIAKHAKSKKKEEAKPALHNLGEGVPAAAPASTPAIKEAPVAETKPEVKEAPAIEVVPEVKTEPVTETAPEKPAV